MRDKGRRRTVKDQQRLMRQLNETWNDVDPMMMLEQKTTLVENRKPKVS
jgi:hypothetical protein